MDTTRSRLVTLRHTKIHSSSLLKELGGVFKIFYIYVQTNTHAHAKDVISHSTFYFNINS